GTRRSSPPARRALADRPSGGGTVGHAAARVARRGCCTRATGRHPRVLGVHLDRPRDDRDRRVARRLAPRARTGGATHHPMACARPRGSTLAAGSWYGRDGGGSVPVGGCPVRPEPVVSESILIVE